MVDRKSAKHRLQIVRGHVDKIIDMTDKGAYCIDMIHQLQAVRSAIKKTELEILNQHLNSCVVEQIKQGKSKEVIDEIVKVMERNS